MAHLKAVNQSVSVDKVIKKANYLYEKYINTDFCEWAEKNRASLNEKKPHKQKILSFFRKLI